MLVAAGGGSPRSLPPPPRDSRGREAGTARAASPSPSVLSEGREEQERLQREEREKRLRLQLYVFIARCIAHPFNAKQPTDMARRQQKVSPRLPAALPGRVPSPPRGPSRAPRPARRGRRRRGAPARNRLSGAAAPAGHGAAGAAAAGLGGSAPSPKHTLYLEIRQSPGVKSFKFLELRSKSPCEGHGSAGSGRAGAFCGGGYVPASRRCLMGETKPSRGASCQSRSDHLYPTRAN